MYTRKNIREYQDNKCIVINMLILNLHISKNIPSIIDLRENKQRYFNMNSVHQSIKDKSNVFIKTLLSRKLNVTITLTLASLLKSFQRRMIKY